MASENCTCAVDLLSHYQPRQGMGNRHLPERQKQLRALSCRIRPTARRPNSEHNVLTTLIAPRTKPCRESFRGHLTAAAIQQNSNDGSPTLLLIKELPKGILTSKTLGSAAGQGGTALKVFLNHRLNINLRPGTGAKMSQSDLHEDEDSASTWPA
jgi:hypothetical protein